MRSSKVLALLGIAMLMTTACVRDDISTVDVLVGGDPHELAAYRNVVAAYAARNDEVDVRLVEVAERDELIARLSTSIASGGAPDLFLLNYRYYGQFATRGVLEPLGTWLDDSNVIQPGDFYAQALEAFQFDGQQICMPQNISSLVVYFNRDLFRERGVREPGEGWTWAEMVVRAASLTRDVDDDGTVDVYGLGVEPEIIRLAPFVWSNGGNIVDDEDDPTRLTLAAPEASRATQMFLGLRSRYGVVPTDEEVEAQDLQSRFLQGRLAMLMESRRVVPSFRTISRFDWDVAPLPVIRDPATVLHSDAYCMIASSDVKDEAWSFVEFAVGEEGQTIMAQTGRTVPSFVDVAESDVFLDRAERPRSSDVFLESIPDIRAVPVVSTWAEIEDAANAVLEESFYGGGEAAEAALTIDAMTAPLFARAE